MTLVLDTVGDEPPLPSAAPPLPSLVTAGCSVPAAALTDRELARWVRSHGVSVTARDDRDLDALRYNNIRAVQVVFRCGADTATLRRAVDLGVPRFIVGTSQHMARIGECAHSTKYLYLDDQAPLMLGDKRLKVIGLHTEVTNPDYADEWASSAQRLISRSAVLKACGSTVKRITVSGGSTQLWLSADTGQARVIVDAVDRAVGGECHRWQLPRPAVTLAPVTAAHNTDMANG